MAVPEEPLTRPVTKVVPFMLFMAEPVIFRRLERLRSRGHALLLIPLMYLGVLLAVNASTLGPNLSGIPDVWCYEASRLLPAIEFGCEYQPEPEFSLLHDLPTFLIEAILAFTPYIVYRQWLHLYDLIPNMISRGLIKCSFDDLRSIAKEIQVANRYYVAAGRHGGLWAVISIFSALLVCAGYGQLGMYESFAPSNVSGDALRSWTILSYQNWWANYDTRPAGWLAYIALSSFGLFFIIMMNVGGMRAVWLFYKIRRLIVFQANVDIVDGYWGFSQLRQVLKYSYIALSLHGIAMALDALSMSGPAAFLFLGPLLGQWLIVLPVMIILPIALLGRDIPPWRTRELQRIQLAINRLSAQGSDNGRLEAEIAGLRERADRVRAVRSLPFAKPQDLFYVGLSVVGSLITIVVAFPT